jgi:hypothetical protein
MKKLRVFIALPVFLFLFQTIDAVQLNGKEVAKENFLVWLFIGHSNMAGRYNSCADFTVDDDRIFKNMGSGWYRAKEPYSHNPNYGGPCNFFLEKLVEMYPADQYPDLHFGVINNGMTKKTCSSYMGGHGDQIIDWANEVKDECTIAGVFVLLGYMETDNGNIDNDAVKIINKFRNDLGIPDLPFVWGKMEDSGTPSSAQRAILNIPNKITNTVLNPITGPCPKTGGGTGGLPQEDNHSCKNICNGGGHHFNWYGYKRWGYECVKLIHDNDWFPYDPCDDTDTEPPTAPTNLALTDSTMTTLTLSWTASTDNQMVSSYLLFNGTDEIGKAPGSATSFEFTELQHSTAYNLTLKAADCVPNVSGPSNTVTANTKQPVFAKMPLMINLGGTATGDYLADKQWEANSDFGYTGSPSPALADKSVTGSTDPVYETMLHGSEFGYKIFSGPGTFKVTLKLCDFWREGNNRIFTADINGTKTNININEESGQNTKPWDFTQDVEVTDDFITMDFAKTCDQYCNPIVNGIVIEQTGASVAVSGDRSHLVAERPLSILGASVLVPHAKTGDNIVVSSLDGRVIYRQELVAPVASFTLPSVIQQGMYVIQYERDGRTISSVPYVHQFK